jgi:hypothetical protein
MNNICIMYESKLLVLLFINLFIISNSLILSKNLNIDQVNSCVRSKIKLFNLLIKIELINYGNRFNEASTKNYDIQLGNGESRVQQHCYNKWLLDKDYLIDDQLIIKSFGQSNTHKEIELSNYEYNQSIICLSLFIVSEVITIIMFCVNAIEKLKGNENFEMTTLLVNNNNTPNFSLVNQKCDCYEGNIQSIKIVRCCNLGCISSRLFKLNKICVKCNGNGSALVKTTIICDRCGGCGYRIVERTQSNKMLITSTLIKVGQWYKKTLILFTIVCCLLSTTTAFTLYQYIEVIGKDAKGVIYNNSKFFWHIELIITVITGITILIVYCMCKKKCVKFKS